MAGTAHSVVDRQGTSATFVGIGFGVRNLLEATKICTGREVEIQAHGGGVALQLRSWIRLVEGPGVNRRA